MRKHWAVRIEQYIARLISFFLCVHIGTISKTGKKNQQRKKYERKPTNNATTLTIRFVFVFNFFFILFPLLASCIEWHFFTVGFQLLCLFIFVNIYIVFAWNWKRLFCSVSIIPLSAFSVAYWSPDGHSNWVSIHIGERKVRTARIRQIKLKGNQRQPSKWETERNNWSDHKPINYHLFWFSFAFVGWLNVLLVCAFGCTTIHLDAKSK